MSSFLNVDLDGKINTNFLLKHILFSFYWIFGILLFVFRLDILIADKYAVSLSWLKISLPMMYLLLLVVSFFFLRWYYIIAFVFYPLLILFWFLPKTILSVGKVYLFGSYLGFIFSRLAHFKLLIANAFLAVFSFILLVTVGASWVRWLSIGVMSYFYLIYVYRFLRKAFQTPRLFGIDIEESLRKAINNASAENSFIVKAYILQKQDENLQEGQIRASRIKRAVMAKFMIELLTERLNSFRGRKAYIISWIFGATVFLSYSIIFFWFINYQLFKIDHSNFAYSGMFPSFDFLYYTLKTITYGDIELIKPLSRIARVSETSSFVIIGIFILVIVVSILLSIKQDQVNENVKLTTDMFNYENAELAKYVKEQFGVEISAAMQEIENIDTSLKKLKGLIDKMF